MKKRKKDLTLMMKIKMNERTKKKRKSKQIWWRIEQESVKCRVEWRQREQ